MNSTALEDQFRAAIDEASDYLDPESTLTFFDDEIPAPIERILKRLNDELDKGYERCSHLRQQGPQVELIFVSHAMYPSCAECIREDISKIHKAEREFGHTCWSCGRTKIQDYELFLRYKNLVIVGLLCECCIKECGYDDRDIAQLRTEP